MLIWQLKRYKGIFCFIKYLNVVVFAVVMAFNDTSLRVFNIRQYGLRFLTRPDVLPSHADALLDGGDSASIGEAGSLVNAYVSGSSGRFLGSLVTSREGTITMTAGTVTVVADSRLNRLIAQGTASDIEPVRA